MKISDFLFFSSSVDEKEKNRTFLNVLLGGPILYKTFEP